MPKVYTERRPLLLVMKVDNPFSSRSDRREINISLLVTVAIARQQEKWISKMLGNQQENLVQLFG